MQEAWQQGLRREVGLGRGGRVRDVKKSAGTGWEREWGGRGRARVLGRMRVVRMGWERAERCRMRDARQAERGDVRRFEERLAS